MRPESLLEVLASEPVLRPSGVGYDEPFNAVKSDVLATMGRMLAAQETFGWTSDGGVGMVSGPSTFRRAHSVEAISEAGAIERPVEVFTALARALGPMVGVVEVPTEPYWARERQRPTHFPGAGPILGGAIGRRAPALDDIHWFTYLSKPYRSLIPDDAIGVLRERFGFEEFPDGAFRFVLLPDPYEAFADPDALERARAEFFELVGDRLAREVPPEISEILAYRPPRR